MYDCIFIWILVLIILVRISVKTIDMTNMTNIIISSILKM